MRLVYGLTVVDPDVMLNKRKSSSYRNYIRPKMLQIKLSDIHRATLPVKSGNEGWIGVSPTGDEYHVVVPVDVQIARGVLACNLPTDGTPFGGYAGWLYFRCPQYENVGTDERALREQTVLATAERLISWLKSFQIDVHIETAVPGDEKLSYVKRESLNQSPDDPAENDGIRTGQTARPLGSTEEQTRSFGSSDLQRCGAVESSDSALGPIHCTGCKTSWGRLVALIKDPETGFAGYRACADDFPQGSFLFSHNCGGTIEVPVSRFARSHHRGKSLIGTHACPGFCYYETSSRECAAECEGASYRRIAEKLRSRKNAKGV
jgi:hypothetical protein